MTDALREGFALGGYQIEAYTANHATGAMYQARDVATGTSVAIHVVASRLASHPGFRDRFRRELAAVASLFHPHLLNVFETGEAREFDVLLWAAMAPAPGPDLTTITERGSLDPPRAARVVAQVARGLGEVHGQGVLHRGLEPGSVLVDEALGGEDAGYLWGFGLVDDGAIGGGTGDIHRSIYPPSPDYVAPEQITGGPVDHRADLYALGGVLYFALTGRPPFPGASIEETLDGHLKRPAPVPSQTAEDVPATLDGVIARCLAKNPSERYPSATAMADDILGVVDAGELQPHPAPVPIQPSAPSSPPAPDPEVPEQGTAADKRRVIQAWTDAVNAGGRMWSPSAVGAGIPGASAAAPAEPEAEADISGDLTPFETARRRRTEPTNHPGVGSPPAPPSTARRRSTAPRRHKVVVIVAAVVVLAALALAALLLTNGSDSDADGSRSSTPRGSEPARKPHPAAPKTPARGATSGGAGAPAARKDLIRWPPRSGYTAVVFAGSASRLAAVARARRAAATGVPAGVLHSDDYGSLQPGYWVAFAGVYSSQAKAKAMATDMRRKGVADRPYVRRIAQQP